MTTITIRELHDNTEQWVRQVGEHGEIAVVDSGLVVARLVGAEAKPPASRFARRQLLPEFAALSEKPIGGPDSTDVVSEDRDRTCEP